MKAKMVDLIQEEALRDSRKGEQSSIHILTWYEALIEDCKDLITEVEFTSRWTLIEGYHSLGSRILQENENFDRAKIYGQGICNAIAESLGRRPRTIYYAMQFAKEYPDLNLLPEGKNISWSHVVNKYLTDGTEKKIVKKADLYKMIREIKELLEKEYLLAKQDFISSGKAGNMDLCESSQCTFIRYLQDQVNKITGGLDSI